LIFLDRGAGWDVSALSRFYKNLDPRFCGGVFEEEFAAGGVGDDEGGLGGFVEEEASTRHFELEIDLGKGAGRADS
jgi:hypothetical protein